MKVAFLHTLSANQTLLAPYVDKLKTDVSDIADVTHHVKEDLLKDPEEKKVHEALTSILESDEPDIVVCTCSTIGGMAESFQTTATTKTKILRVDRPMAEVAVKNYSDIDVVATLESTLQPTKDLLETCAKAKGGDGTVPTIELSIVPEAFEDYYKKDDHEGYAQTIATFILEKYGAEPKNREKHVIVLAQASMAPAVALVETARRHQVRMSDTNAKMLSLPQVLSSPETCMERIQELVTTAKEGK